jgi:hypothetical protein
VAVTGDGVTGEQRKLCYGELHDLHASANAINVITSGRCGRGLQNVWGRKMNTDCSLISKTEGKNKLQDHCNETYMIHFLFMPLYVPSITCSSAGGVACSTWYIAFVLCQLAAPGLDSSPVPLV